jgi:ribosomal protein S18 acetylase RimI-like enzyme
MSGATSLTLRRVAASDSPFLHAVYASTRADELAMVDWDEATKAAFVRMQFHAQHTGYAETYGAADFHIVLLDDQPIGRLYVDRTGRSLHVIDIALLPEYRGRGIGTALLGELFAEAAQDNRPVTIHVERFNRAQALYERLGFERVSEAGLYWLMRRPPRRADSPLPVGCDG